MIMAEKITMLRKQNAWSQEELAEKMGISRQSVSKWESGASIPDLDKIVKMSALFGVSTDYLIKDDLEELSYSETDDIPEGEQIKSVSLDEANSFMELTRGLSKKIAAAVWLCIVSPICVLVLGGMSEYKPDIVSEDMAGGVGAAVLLVLVAIGVAVLVMNGLRLGKYEYLEKEEIRLEYGVYGIVQKKKEDFSPRFRTSITIGVVLCILGVVPLLLAAAFGLGDFAYVCCVGVLLLMVACGVFLFVDSGMIYGCYDKLLQEGDYTPEKKEVGRKTAFFPGVYWCVVTALYLAVSLYTDKWNTTWIVWPVAGVLFAAICGIINVVMKPKK